jgi:hypothetical protein
MSIGHVMYSKTSWEVHIIFEKLVVIDVNLEESPRQVWKLLEVMGAFEEVSKVVPLWHRFKHGPHRKTL